MLCAIYRSSKRDQTYLYIEKRNDFSRVPEALMVNFGFPQFVMLFLLNGSKKLIAVDNGSVHEALIQKGYYLQLPPLAENLLEQHKRSAI